MHIRSLAALALVTALAGCQSFAPAPVVQGDASAKLWQARQAKLTNLDTWALTGRAASGGGFGLKGSLRWVQRGDQFTLSVRGPFGIGAAQLRGTPARVEVRSGKQRWITNEPEELLRQEFGWSLPVRALRYWVLGLPAPGAPADFSLDAKGRINALTQAGWTVQYADYAPAPLLELPGALQAQQGDTTLKLSIDQWDVSP